MGGPPRDLNSYKKREVAVECTISEDLAGGRTAQQDQNLKALHADKDQLVLRTHAIGEDADRGVEGSGNHALQDYQMQLMLLEEQNKQRLLETRQEQDEMAGMLKSRPKSTTEPSHLADQKLSSRKRTREDDGEPPEEQSAQHPVVSNPKSKVFKASRSKRTKSSNINNRSSRPRRSNNKTPQSTSPVSPSCSSPEGAKTSLLENDGHVSSSLFAIYEFIVDRYI
jgi:hypothetical protein